MDVTVPVLKLIILIFQRGWMSVWTQTLQRWRIYVQAPGIASLLICFSQVTMCYQVWLVGSGVHSVFGMDSNNLKNKAEIKSLKF